MGFKIKDIFWVFVTFEVGTCAWQVYMIPNGGV
jgi:hypothetical protein